MVALPLGLRPRLQLGLEQIGETAVAQFLETCSIPKESQPSRAGTAGRVELWSFSYRIDDLRKVNILCPPAVNGFVHDGSGSTDLAALAILQLHLPSNRQDGAICVLAGFRVADWAARKGVGTSLYFAMLAHAFQRCQTPKHELDVPVTAVHPQMCQRLVGRTEPIMSLQLGDGSCRREGAMLAFLKKFGWEQDVYPCVWRLDRPYLDPLQSSVSFGAPDPHRLVSKKQKAFYDDRKQLNVMLEKIPKPLYPRGAIPGNLGVFEFVLPAVFCAKVVCYLDNPDSWAKDTVGTHLVGFLPQQGCSSKERVYSMKPHSNVNADSPSSVLQEKYNAISKCPAQAAEMLDFIPGLACLARGALIALGLRERQLDISASSPVCVHVFKLTPDNQMSYGWHADDTDLVTLITKKSPGLSIRERERLSGGIRSVVIQLSPSGKTAMVMWGSEKAVYHGQGAAKAFHGTCLHASVPWALEPNTTQKPVWKISIFWSTSSLGLPPDLLRPT